MEIIVNLINQLKIQLVLHYNLYNFDQNVIKQNVYTVYKDL